MPREDARPRVLALAGRQHGAIASAQLFSAGLGRHHVARLVGTGWLRRLHHGVYLVGPLQTPLTRAMAAVLAYGAQAVSATPRQPSCGACGPRRCHRSA